MTQIAPNNKQVILIFALHPLASRLLHFNGQQKKSNSNRFLFAILSEFFFLLFISFDSSRWASVNFRLRLSMDSDDWNETCDSINSNDVNWNWFVEHRTEVQISCFTIDFAQCKHMHEWSRLCLKGKIKAFFAQIRVNNNTLSSKRNDPLCTYVHRLVTTYEKQAHRFARPYVSVCSS